MPRVKAADDMFLQGSSELDQMKKSELQYPGRIERMMKDLIVTDFQELIGMYERSFFSLKQTMQGVSEL
jgi:hypothetical protein